MSGWRAEMLGNLAAPTKSAFATGPFGSSVSAQHFRDTGVPMLRGSNLSEDIGIRLNQNDMVFLDEDLAAKFSRSTVGVGDLVFTCWGTVGQIGIIDSADHHHRYVISNKQMKMTPDSNRVDSLFLYYYLSQPSMIDLVKGQAIGSSVPGFNLGQLRGLPIRLPDLVDQRAIAEVLGAFDDKISTNKKMTRSIDDLLIAKALLLTATGSGAQFRLDALVESAVGGDWGVAEPNDVESEKVYCIRGADIADLQGSGLGKMPIRSVKPASLSRRQLAHGDIVIEISGGSPTQSTGRALLITDALLSRLDYPVVNSNFCRMLRLREPDMTYFIYALLRRSWSQGEFYQFENGSTGIKNLALSEFSAAKTVSRPNPEELKAFNLSAAALIRAAQSAGEENDRLRAIRDEALPYLMSGKLKVKDAEKQVEAVV